MVSILLVSQNEREKQILKMALEQRGVKVILCCPTYRHYMLILKYSPDVVVMEFPHACADQIHFSHLIKKNRRTQKITIVGYGDPVDHMTKRGLSRQGIRFYLERPLKFSQLLSVVDQILKDCSKSLESVPALSDKEKDLELILNSKALPTQKIEAMIRHVSALMAFPFTVARVLRLTQDQKTGAGDLARAITADPAITAHLLKISNSVFFASSSRRINSIKDAIVRIGFEETKRIVMSMSVINLFDKRKETAGFDRTDFWTHSISVGIVAERIARHMGSVSAEDAFLGGLLHDLGIMILDEFLPSVFDRSLEVTVNSAGHFADCQTEELGVNHVDLLGGLFPIWKIPQDITDGVIGQLRIPDATEEDLNSSGKKLALCIGLANLIAKSLQYGRECDEYAFPVKNELLAAAGLGAGVSKTFMESTANSIELFRRFLHLEKTEEKGLPESQNSTSVGLVNLSGDIFIPVYNYMQKENWNVQLVSPSQEVKTLNGKFDLMLLWDPQSENQALIEQYCRIRKADGKGTAPLFVLAKDWDENMPEQVSHMSSSCDLRHLLLSLSEAVGGRVVRASRTDQDCAPPPQTAEQDQELPVIS